MKRSAMIKAVFVKSDVSADITLLTWPLGFTAGVKRSKRKSRHGTKEPPNLLWSLITVRTNECQAAQD